MRHHPAAAVRIVSYNVLSSHLADAAHFATVDPDHLEASTRFRKVCQKLDQEIRNVQQQHPNPEMEQESSFTTIPTPPMPVIFCLQEVSYDWAGKFHAFFSQRGYHASTMKYCTVCANASCTFLLTCAILVFVLFVCLWSIPIATTKGHYQFVWEIVQWIHGNINGRANIHNRNP
jgi:hypothetical protein